MEVGLGKVTIRDVSRVTGLSTYTVSRALSGAPGVSADSREQVLAAAREIGYIPNRAAQGLRRGSSDSIAVIVASTANSYYLDLMAGIQQALRHSDWTVIIADVAVDGVYNPRLEDRIVQRLIESRTAGIITTLTLSPENTALLANWDIPIVFVDSAPPESANFPSVTTDNYNASLMVGEHLAEHGYRDWLFLVYPQRWTTRIDRERGIRDAAISHNAHVEVLESENDEDSAFHTLEAYLAGSARIPRVLIAGNNPLLLGALRLLRDRGIRIPADMAVIGYDEFAWASLLDPPLTVLDEDSEGIGRLAGQTLAQIINEQVEAARSGQSQSPVYRAEYRQQVAGRLIVRRSCGCHVDNERPR